MAQLRDGAPVEREAAIARLRVIGARAIARLTALARSAAPDVARAAAVKALEGIDDPRTRAVVLDLAAADSPAVAAASIAAARPWLGRDAAVLDLVAAAALDARRPQAVRTAAVDALAELPAALVGPVLERLRAEAPAMAERADGHAPSLDEPEGVREWLALRGGAAPLSEIHDAIVRMRERERDAPPGRRDAWRTARGAAHLALASRGSRVALYDLRETFETAAGPVPLDFLAAAAAAGDATCLEPLAKAWAAAHTDPWWRERLAETARAILTREKLTSRNSIVKRVRTRHPGFTG